MSRISRNLSQKLSLGIMLLAVPLFLLSLGVFYLQSRHLVKQEASERSASILETAVFRVSNYMSSIEASTNANARLVEENFQPDNLETVSRRIVRLNPNVLSCSVSAVADAFPQYGRYLSVYSVNEGDTIVSVRETNYEYTDKEWFRVPVATGKAGWTEPFSEHAEGTIDHSEAVATYSRPLRDKDGRIVGVLSTDFSFSQLATAINATEHPYPNAYFVLVGGDGRYFVHPDTTQLFRKTVFTDADPYSNADRISLGYQMTAGKLGSMHLKLNGKKYHVSYQPVPGTNWSLAMVCPDREILSGYYRLGIVIIIIFILGLLAIRWLCKKVVRQTVRPLNQLVSHTQQIADGNYDDVLPRSELKDGIGQLQNSFVAMQEALRDRMGSISRTAEEIRKHNEQRARDMELAEEAVRKKTIFIQNLSHQIRTPLNIILGFAGVIRESIAAHKQQTSDDPFLEEDLNDVISMMKYNAIHLKRMVLMLFDSSSATGADELMNNRKDEVSCNEMARGCIQYTEENFHGLKIKLDTELVDGVQILTNDLYLMRSLRELLYNAAKYSDGKHIRVHVSETTTTVRFTVEDEGPGLPESNADELLYKPFIKIDDLSEGLGLGLPLCKRHALSLGGDLIYDRDYKDGCRFILEMPK